MPDLGLFAFNVTFVPFFGRHSLLYQLRPAHRTDIRRRVVLHFRVKDQLNRISVEDHLPAHHAAPHHRERSTIAEGP